MGLRGKPEKRVNTMKVISENNFSLAWLKALELLLECGGKTSHLNVVIENVDKEDTEIRHILDDFINRKNMTPVSTVANTIFPTALYYPTNPKLMGCKARHHLYQMYEKGNVIRQRIPANRRGTYFNRMIDWTGSNGRKINQIERIIERLQNGLTQKKPFSSIYEMNMGGVEECTVDDATEEIQIYRPDKDTSIRGFPCLSHISLTLHKGYLDMNAIYRNQYFIQKAYGNFLGLSRLLKFICQEVGCEAGELVCMASHAELEVGKRDIVKLIQECKEASQSSQVGQWLM